MRGKEGVGRGSGSWGLEGEVVGGWGGGGPRW